MNTKWTKPTQSGLADRLTDLILLAAYGRSKNGLVWIPWEDFKPGEFDVKHRSIDIKLSNVLKYMRFPKELVFEKITYEGNIDFYLGAAVTPYNFYHDTNITDLKNTCTYSQFLTNYELVKKDFTFCEEITNYLTTLPQDFITFHIRRGDKVRPGNHDGYFISSHELDELDNSTKKAMDFFYSFGYRKAFLCGDEDEKIKPFAEYLSKQGWSYFQTPYMEKWKQTYYDLATMTKSKVNIASQRYSSFSRWPSLISGSYFDTVFSMIDWGII